MQCQFVPSVCSYCGTGCGVLFEVIDGNIVSTLPMKTHPVNHGKLCIKGWNLHEHVNSELRLKQPLVKTMRSPCFRHFRTAGPAGNEKAQIR